MFRVSFLYLLLAGNAHPFPRESRRGRGIPTEGEGRATKIAEETPMHVNLFTKNCFGGGEEAASVVTVSHASRGETFTTDGSHANSHLTFCAVPCVAAFSGPVLHAPARSKMRLSARSASRISMSSLGDEGDDGKQTRRGMLSVLGAGVIGAAVPQGERRHSHSNPQPISFDAVRRIHDM